MRHTLTLLGCALTQAACHSGNETITYYRDVLPIIQENCQACHREGEIAPMPLLTLQDVMLYSGAIKKVVAQRVMPPWFADPQYGHFENDRAMAQKDIDKLVAWIDGGMAHGQPSDAPALKKWAHGWQIGEPDMVLSMKEAFSIPEQGTVNYKYVLLPTGFTEDRYIERAEIRPGNAAVVHHIIALIRKPGSSMLKDSPQGVMVDQSSVQADADAEFLSAYAPGSVPAVLKPGQAKLIKAGSDIVLQVHYQTNGNAATDLSKIGLIFSKTPPKERVMTLAVSDTTFVIPPGADNVESKAQVVLQDDVSLVSMLPHMHTRGKDFMYTAVYPDGQREILLSVPRYDFDWQLTYQLVSQKRLPKGTIIECLAHFDNSKNNPLNPNPEQEVRYGQQTWDEMMIGYVDVAVPFGKEAHGLLSPGP